MSHRNPSVLGLLKCLLYRQQNQLLCPAPCASDLEEVCESRGQGEKAWKKELVARLVGRDLGPGPFSSGSARGREL